MPEISSIVPKATKIGDRKVIAGRTTVQKPEEIKFSYDLSGYTTFEQEGFQPPEPNERFDVTEREFLKQVNLDYGKVKVRVRAIMRRKEVDPSTGERRERKEYLTVICHWYAYDYFGAEIRVLEHIEGQYKKQTRKLVNKLDKNTGRMHSWYEMGEPVMAYTIPFSKQNVDKYILDPHPFGEDSENITNPDQVTYYGKFEHEDTAQVSHRDNTFNYDQLKNTSWREFCDLSSRPGGPRNKKQYREVEPNPLQHMQ